MKTNPNLVKVNPCQNVYCVHVPAIKQLGATIQHKAGFN